MQRNPLSFAKLTLALLTAVTASAASAETIDVSFTRLSGMTGVEGTAVFMADLSSLPFSHIQSITLVDSNSGIGGSPGAFSGFDLDAIKLSTVYASNASDASLAPGLDVFDFTPAGTLFTPGAQRSPADAKLNGTDGTGSYVDSAFASLNQFDAVWFAEGSVSLGDGGSIAFNLTEPVLVSGLYLYVGEVSGDPGEALNGRLLISNLPAVPEPSVQALMLVGFLGVACAANRRRKQKAA